MIPLLIIILVLLVYLFISFLYCKKMYLSKKVEKDQAKSINKAYNIATFIFAFVNQKISKNMKNTKCNGLFTL